LQIDFRHAQRWNDSGEHAGKQRNRKGKAKHVPIDPVTWSKRGRFAARMVVDLRRSR